MFGEVGGRREEGWRVLWICPPGHWTSRVSRNNFTLTTFHSPHCSRCCYTPPLRRTRHRRSPHQPPSPWRPGGRQPRSCPMSVPSVVRCSVFMTDSLSTWPADTSQNLQRTQQRLTFVMFVREASPG